MNLTKLAESGTLQRFREAYEQIKKREIVTGERDETCQDCFGTGFRKVTGGVTKCDCRTMTDDQRERVAIMLEHMPEKLADKEFARICGGQQ